MPIAGVPGGGEAKHDGVLGKINAHFAVDNSGMLYMEKAEYQVEVIDMVEVAEPPPPPPPPPPKEKEDKKAKKGKKAEKVGIEAVNASAEDAPEDAPPTPPETNDADVEPPAARRLLSTENDAADADADADADAEEGEGAAAGTRTRRLSWRTRTAPAEVPDAPLPRRRRAPPVRGSGRRPAGAAEDAPEKARVPTPARRERDWPRGARDDAGGDHALDRGFEEAEQGGRG